MALKKSQLYSSLWQSCDELRGGMDASQYKDYVLTLLFMKYVSDRYAGRPDAIIVVPEGGGFADMVKLKGDKEIGDRINKIIGNLAEANDLKGVIDQADFNDSAKLGTGKEMQDRLSKLVAIFEGLDLSANRAEGDDLLGDAYEYLMRHFATESGKSKGQFYTPSEVSRIMAKVIGFGPETRPDQTLYDPTCGSGSLLLKAADEAPNGITVYGQEMDNATWALARMNMFLHGHPTADLWRGNTLAAPYFKNPDGSLKTFDFAVANPPFSAKAWSNGLDPVHDEFRRFEYGIPPARNGDYAFLLHLVASLRSKGKGAIILPHGVLFRGNREADIRRNLVRRGLIRGIIGLPANLFYGTGIPACILVIDKESAGAHAGISTELGLIPAEWSTCSIGELFDFLRTASNSRTDLDNTGDIALQRARRIGDEEDRDVREGGEETLCRRTGTDEAPHRRGQAADRLRRAVRDLSLYRQAHAGPRSLPGDLPREPPGRRRQGVRLRHRLQGSLPLAGEVRPGLHRGGIRRIRCRGRSGFAEEPASAGTRAPGRGSRGGESALRAGGTASRFHRLPTLLLRGG